MGDVSQLPEPYKTAVEARMVNICEHVEKLMTIAAEFNSDSVDMSTKSGYVVSIRRKRQTDGG